MAATILPMIMLLLAACTAGDARSTASRVSPASTTDGQRILAVTPAGGTVVLEVVRTPARRARGLMFREQVPAGTGMLFVFEAAGRHSFWMLNCKIALDIAWLDEEQEIVHLAENLPPCPAEPCPSYAPDAPARYAVEVAAGYARPLGLVPGARLALQTLDDQADDG